MEYNDKNIKTFEDISHRCNFVVDKTKCTKCGRCKNVCSGMVIDYDKDGYPYMKPFERFGWRGCWKCEHCLAVCPVGAISIFRKRAENSTPPPSSNAGDEIERLVKFRRSCRRFFDKNVDPLVIDKILSCMENVPTGGNSMSVEYTVIDDKDVVNQIRQTAYAKMDALANRHVYTSSFSDFYYSKMKESEKTVRNGDLLFCGAPHLFIAHKRASGKWAEDAKTECVIASTYFEIIANAYGLGTTIMSYSAEVISELSPEARAMMEIPKDHCMPLIIGFGYPEITYSRGVQKDRTKLIHRRSDRLV